MLRKGKFHSVAQTLYQIKTLVKRREATVLGAVIDKVMYRCCQNVRINRLEAATMSAT